MIAQGSPILSSMISDPEKGSTAGELETSSLRSFGEVSSALVERILAENQAFSENGTQTALDYSTLGVAEDSAKRSQWGGARNSAARQSYALTHSQIENLVAAHRHSELINLPFTRMISIHWEAAGVAVDGMAKATGRFVDLLTKTLARNGRQTACVWVHENGDRKGGHCHLLVHIPADLVPLITRRQRGWLRRITGQAYKRNVIHSRPIGGQLGLELSNPTLHAANSLAALGYVLKQTDADTLAAFGLERMEKGGLVVGKRCGTSQNIGSKARAKANSD